MRNRITNTLAESAKPKAKPYEVFDTDVRGFLLRVQPTGRKFYYLAYVAADGRRRRFKLGESPGMKAPAARQAAESARGKVSSKVDPQQDREITRAKLLLEKSRTVGAYLENEHLPGHLQTLKTGAESYERLKRVWKHLFSRPMNSITRREIESWRSERLRSGYSPSGINRDLAPLRTLLRSAVRNEFLEFDPLAGLPSLKLDKTPKVRFLSEDEAGRLRTALADRDRRLHAQRESANQWRLERRYDTYPQLGYYADHLRPMVLLALNTGLRRGELFSLTWSNIDLKARYLTIEGKLSKSGRTRHVPLNDEAANVLKNWREKESGLVFPNSDGERLDNINSSWRRLVKTAGIENFRFHDLRHTFASWLVIRGAPLNTVRELLGHSSMTMTLRYVHLSPDHKSDAVALLNAVEQTS